MFKWEDEVLWIFNSLYFIDFFNVFKIGLEFFEMCYGVLEVYRRLVYIDMYVLFI